VAGGQQQPQQPGEKINPRNVMPDIPNEPTTGALSTSRQASSIPMVPASEQTPTHQQPGSSVWMYPSEQMFFNAMKRKVGVGIGWVLWLWGWAEVYPSEQVCQCHEGQGTRGGCGLRWSAIGRVM
jgi:hypothetical protein